MSDEKRYAHFLDVTSGDMLHCVPNLETWSSWVVNATISRRVMRRILDVGGQLEQFITSFVRDPDGSWVCIEHAIWPGPPVFQVTPGTRFSPGTIIAGIAITKLLDEQYQKQGRRN